MPGTPAFLPQLRPQQRLPLALGAAAAAAVAALFAARLRQTTGSPILALRADGTILEGRRLRTWLTAGRRIRWRVLAPAIGAGEGAWEWPRITLDPASAVLAVASVETLTDGADSAVQIVETGTGRSLFFATDNAHPEARWSGDDPQAPRPLREAQALADFRWEEERRKNPEAERVVLTGYLSDLANNGELSPAGWTGAGHLLVRGRTRMGIEVHPGESELSEDHVAWWGVIAAAGDAWSWLVRSVGEPPAEHAPVPTPAPALPLRLEGRTLLVDGAVQTDPLLAPGITDADGPWA